MSLRPSGMTSLLASTFGRRTPICALALGGLLAAWHEPAAGIAGAALLLLARALRAAVRADDTRRALIHDNARVAAMLHVAQHDRLALEAGVARARQEAADAARSAAFDECADTLKNARHKLSTSMQTLIDSLDIVNVGDVGATRRPQRRAMEILALVLHDALESATPESRTIVFDEVPVDLRELIDGVALLVAPVATRRQSTLQTCIDRSVAAAVLADPARLGQIAFMLLAYALETSDAGTVTLTARAESLSAGAQRVVIGINGAPPVSGDAQGVRADGALAEAADRHDHPDLALCRVVAQKMGGDITILAGENVGVCVAFHAPFTIERHEWPNPTQRWAIVDVDTYEDRQALCELLKKLGVTTLPSDARSPVRIDYRFAQTCQPPSMHGEKQAFVMTLDALPGGMRERDGVTRLSLRPLSWTALVRICGAQNGPAPAARAPLASAGPSAASGPATILVTDDNEVNRKVLAKQLDVLGYRCLVASSGDEALALLAREAVDLLITDLQMPGMDGVELARRVDAMLGDPARALPIVLMSANADAPLASAERALFGAILVKTSRLSTLGAALERLLPARTRPRPAHVAPRLESHDFTALDSLAAQGIDVDALLREWHAAMESDLAQFAACRASHDEAAIRRALHRLAGAVGIVGDRGLMDALEHASGARRLAGDVLLDGLVTRIRTLMQRLDNRVSRRTFAP
jgi:CheY-like chemotaxis protein